MLLKKKNLIILSIILISILGLTLISADSCSDSDGGKIYKTQGTTSGSFDGVPFSNADWCLTGGLELSEYFCSGNVPGQETINCASKYGSDWKCSNGVCIQNQQSCLDTDGSNDKNKGVVTTNYNGAITTYTDQCSNRVANSVVEYICQNNWVATTTIDCTTKYGVGWYCLNGVCAKADDTCSDSDLGTINQYKTKGTITGKFDGVSFSNTDFCNSGSNLLTEYVCNAYGQGDQELIDCTTKYGLSYTCSDGVCAKADDTCSDTDGGSVYTTKGTVKSKFGGVSHTNADWCDVEGNLIEYSCTLINPPQVFTETINCASKYGSDFGCYEGKCSNNNGSECKLTKPEECGDGILNICDEKECKNCGYYFTKNPILPGGKCTLEEPLPECKSCDEFALSYLIGSVWKSKSCDPKGWTLQWSFFFIKPPQGATTCLLSLIKLILMPIVLIFGFLFINDFFDNKIKSLKGKNNKFIRIILSGIIAILLACLVYVMFIVGLILFIIVLIIKMAIKTIL